MWRVGAQHSHPPKSAPVHLHASFVMVIRIDMHEAKCVATVQLAATKQKHDSIYTLVYYLVSEHHVLHVLGDRSGLCVVNFDNSLLP